MRLSNSNIVLDNDQGTSNPSAAIKFLVNNKQSANLIVAIDFKNQANKDFFPREGTAYKPFSTHTGVPSKETHPCEFETFIRKLVEASDFPFSLGTGHIADARQDGEDVQFPKWPFEVQLRPNPAVLDGKV